MKLKEEWKSRIDIWIQELKNHFYYELGHISFEGMFTMERLRYEEAEQRQTYQTIHAGMEWGRKWEYGWFKGTVTLPKEAEGHRLCIKPGFGGEMLIWVNHKAAGAVDLEHDNITLTRNGEAGETFYIVAESYAGHGPRMEKGGPCPPERTAVPEPPLYQVKTGTSSFGIWNEDAFQLYIDAFTLNRLYQSLDEKSLRAMKIRSGLEKFTKVAQFELPYDERNQTYREARKILLPLLQCRNGSTVPNYTIFGQSHLDLAWKWPWEETIRKCARTISTQLAFMEEYEEYRFLLCEPPITETLQEQYTEIYDRVIKKTEEGRFIPEGGMYVESDTNLPSGESLIRQCIWGKRWFKEELGCDVKMVWLPDCFGFSGQMPQIMKKSGLKYFATQKIGRALKGAEVFPYNIFMWEGIDGSRILTHFFKKNNARFDPYFLNERWYEDRVQQEDIDAFLYPFGFGDGGGGPTREMIEIVRRCEDLEGAPRTKTQSPISFFEKIEEQGLPENVYSGEIYLPWHRGTYTAQAKTKQNNRRAEFALRNLEFWGCLSFGNDSRSALIKQTKRLWKTLLFNQFHDILPGTSMERVQQEAERDLEWVIEEAVKSEKEIVKSMVQEKDDCLTVFNSLSWDRIGLIELKNGVTRALDGEGAVLKIQEADKRSYAAVTVPACGYTTVRFLGENAEEQLVREEKNLVQMTECAQNEMEGVHILPYEDGIVMENVCLRILIDSYGRLTSIYDKDTQIEFVDGACNELRMYQDINIDYDAWELSSFYDELPVLMDQPAELTILCQGRLFGKVSIKRKIHDSVIEQEIVMTADGRRVDFNTMIDWRETHKILKVVFPVNVFADEALEEIQFGYVKRPVGRSRRFEADRYEVCNHKYTVLAEAERGFAVLNDCKYGVSTNGNSIELSLLRAPLWPDMHADKGVHVFTYSFYAYTGSFHKSDVVRQGYELNTKLSIAEGDGGTKSFIQISHPGIILETVKPAEDGSNDLILRLYEAHKNHVSCLLHLDFAARGMYETDLLEDVHIRDFDTVLSGENEAMLSFEPFEIKTIRVCL